jgi:hypothetical protein
MAAPKKEITVRIRGETIRMRVPVTATDDQIRAAAKKEYEDRTRTWSDVPRQALENAPQSAANFVRAMIEPFLDPLTTLYVIGKLKSGVESKIGDALFGSVFRALGIEGEEAGAIRDEIEKEADAVGQMLIDRYGSEEALKRTMATDPVGFMADLSAVVTGGGAGVSRLPGVAGQVGRRIMQAGQMADPVNAPIQATRGAGWLGTRVARGYTGMTTGAGDTPLVEAYRYGQRGTPEQAAAVREGMSGSGNAPTPQELVERTRAAVSELRNQRNQAYANSKAGLRLRQPVRNLRPIMDVFRRVQSSLIEGGFAKSREGVEALEEAARVWQELNDAVAARGPNAQITAMDLDSFKQRLNSMRETVTPNTQPDRVLTQIHNGVRAEINRIDSGYADMNQAYDRASSQIRELERALSTGRRASVDTAYRKLASTMRGGVNANFNYRDELLQGLDEIDPTLRATIAGQSLQATAPQGLARLGAIGGGVAASAGGGPVSWPVAAAHMATFSPRIMGEMAHRGGQFAGAIDRLPQMSIGGIRPIQPNTANVARIAGEAEQGVEESVPGYSPDTNLLQSLIPGAQAAPAPSSEPTRVTVTPNMSPEELEILRQWELQQGMR